MRIARALAIASVLLARRSARARPPRTRSATSRSTTSREVEISSDRVDVLLRPRPGGDPDLPGARPSPARGPRAQARRGRARPAPEVERSRLRAARRRRAALSFPAGQGGLKMTRLELPLRRASTTRGGWSCATRPSRTASGGRRSWRRPATAPPCARRRRPATRPTACAATRRTRCRARSTSARDASRCGPGGGTLEAPDGPGAGDDHDRAARSDGLAGVFGDAASGEGVLLLLLLAAFGWGALHALSPGHGKAMVAAYLIGTRGTARHAVALGAIVTVTHTIGVFALGLVTLLLSQYILPEDLYPVAEPRLRAAGRARRGRRAERAGARRRGRIDARSRALTTITATRTITRITTITSPDRVTWKGLIAMGAAAGLIPCPSALVVLLGAIAQHQVALGPAADRGLQRRPRDDPHRAWPDGRLRRRRVSRARVLRGDHGAAGLSAVVIVGVGFVLTAQAIPQVA